MKIYYYRLGEHRFKEYGAYLGFFDLDGVKQTVGLPFSEWEAWDEEKHAFLISLGFKYAA